MKHYYCLITWFVLITLSFAERINTTEQNANTWTMGIIGMCTTQSRENWDPPVGLADAKVSIEMACMRHPNREKECFAVDPSFSNMEIDHASWRNIVMAEGGMDQSAGANYICTSSVICNIAHECFDKKRQGPRMRSKSLKPTNVFRVGNCQLHFFHDSLLGACPDN